MKVATTTVISIVILVFLLFAAGAYFAGQGTQFGARNGTSNVPPPAQPDNSILAGPIVAIGTSTLSIKKQDGTTALITVDASTNITGGTKFRVGEIILVTPYSADPSLAQSIVITAPPQQ